MLLFLDPNAEGSADPADVARKDAQLLRSRGITVLTPSPAQDTNQFVVNAETAERFDLTTVSSLAAVADQLNMGGPPECPVRPFCLPGLRSVYGILFNDFTPLDAGGPLTVDALTRDEIQVGLLFSTDPSIEQHGFVPLLDDRHLQDAENITPDDPDGQVERTDPKPARCREREAHLGGDDRPRGAGRDRRKTLNNVAAGFLNRNGLLLRPRGTEIAD